MTSGIIKSLLPWPLRLLVGAKQALGTLLGLIRTYPREAAIIALMCLSGWLWRGWNAQEAKTAIQHTGWVNEIRLRNDDRKAYQDAQREAEAKAIAAKLAQEAKDEQRRKTADEHLKQDLADDRRRTDDYARRMRYQAPRSAPSGTDLPSGTEAPQVADRSSDVAELVGITRTDLEICTVNSRRLLNAHDWAVGE